VTRNTSVTHRLQTVQDGSLATRNLRSPGLSGSLTEARSERCKPSSQFTLPILTTYEGARSRAPGSEVRWIEMNLSVSELGYVRSCGVHITEKCDGCGSLLNQSVRYTVANRAEVYCSAKCRDVAFFQDQREARKHSSPGKCAYCGGALTGKKKGSIYCDDACRKRASRTANRRQTARQPESRTAIPSNQ
jgi:hypothetical protein